jgi:hypothetical protein
MAQILWDQTGRYVLRCTDVRVAANGLGYQREVLITPDPGVDMRKRIAAAATALAATATVALASPAIAQPPPDQSGLINVNVSDLDVQVPVAVAANICDVSVAVLVSQLRDGAADCAATGDADAITPSGDGAPPRQQGLVNVNLSDVAVQVPVTVAANVCDVSVAVLVDDLEDGSAPCVADADSNAVIIPA